jgi:15,16-dihydrobiliverdin:ferredoxin oxidoreductase
MKTINCAALLSLVATVSSYTLGSIKGSAFVSRPTIGLGLPPKHSGGLTMDMETPNLDYTVQYNLDQLIQESSKPRASCLREAEAALNMPWQESIDKDANDLLYMKFWDWQMKFMSKHLTNVRVLPCSSGETDFTYNENTGKKARIVNLCASSKEYRKIRLTYYDAGDGCQVFNAVWYPDPKYNLPVLGIDLLAFNRKKYLAIVDFQPLHAVELDHAQEYECLLQPIKSKYENLKGKMSSKFYDETQFFSQQMLFSRFENEDIVHDELFPAFQEYVQTHLDLVRSTKPDVANVDQVLKRQRAYDTYSAERDPATGLFCAMFGNEWAQGYVHDFLFSMSERKTGAAATTPVFGGAPPAGVNPMAGGHYPMAAQPQPVMAVAHA